MIAPLLSAKAGVARTGLGAIGSWTGRLTALGKTHPAGSLLAAATGVDSVNVGGSLLFTRGKRKKAAGNEVARSRLVNMLSLVTHTRKQPRLLKYSFEDLLRHRTVHRAWQLFQRKKRQARQVQLEQQYEKMKAACTELEKTDAFLFYEATVRPRTVRFPREMRIPTETPPNKVWDHDWKKPEPPSQA
ncbi:mitochondrial 54S ribosomal protein mL40 [Dipodascopsis tothii]|uniref:mitochondrial 54S ribosomal protein mL40 n=1 Tax=Dipodascopsis tothii TaxID=44089 RepID=UPI0034CE1C5E